MNRVSKRRRRVAAAEAALVTQRQALGQTVGSLSRDAREAVTPGRVVGLGFGLGALLGLLQPSRRQRRARAEAAPGPAGPGVIATVQQAIRLASMLTPIVGPLMKMAMPAADASPPSAAPGEGMPGP